MSVHRCNGRNTYCIYNVCNICNMGDTDPETKQVYVRRSDKERLYDAKRSDETYPEAFARVMDVFEKHAAQED